MREIHVYAATLLHPRERVKEVAELRKQTQWPRKKMWMFTYSSHLTCRAAVFSQHSFFYSLDLAHFDFM